MSSSARIALKPKPAIALFTFGIIGYLGENLAPYFITAISSGLQVSSVTASSVTTAMFIATAVVGLGTGRIAASRHRRILARVGLLVAAVGFAIAAVTPWLWLMFVGAVLAGIGGGAVTSTGGATLAAFRNPDRISGLGGLVNAAATAGVLAVVPLFGLIPTNVFGPLALVCLIAVAVVSWTPKAPVEMETFQSDLENIESAMSAPNSSRRVTVAGLCLLLLFPIWGMTESTVWAMASDMASGQVGMTATQAGGVFSIGEIAALLGAGLLTIVGGRLGRTGPLAVLLVLSAVLKIVMGTTDSSLVWSASFVVWDMVSAVAFLYFIAAAAGLDASGRWSAPMTAAYMVGTAFAPVVGAGIVQGFGFGGFSWVLFIAGLVLIAPTVWLARISTGREREQEATLVESAPREGG